MKRLTKVFGSFEFEKYRYEFGEIHPRWKKVQTTFKFTNNGETDLD